MSVAVPGPEGPAGADGTNGTDGANAYSTANAFTMPAELANVTITTTNSDWMPIGGIVVAQGGSAFGSFEVVSKADSTHAVLKNLEDTGSGKYANNSAPGTVFPNLTLISAGGLQGPVGSAAAGALLSANNLNDLASPATSRTNLGLGTAATRTAGVANLNLPPVDTTFTNGDALFATALGVQSKTAAASRTALGLVIGTNVQAFDATLQSIAALGTAADKIAYTTGVDTWAETALTAFVRTLLDDANILSFLATLQAFAVNQGRICQHQNVDLNALGDTTLPLVTGITAGGYIIEAVILYNCTISLTTARAGVFTAPAAGGTTIAADQVLSAITGSTKFMALTLQAVTGTDWRNEADLYFRVGTAQGAAATGTVVIFGKALAG